MHSYRLRLNFDVRDYECDMIGIVNHANYLHYLEHARHVFLKEQGVDFAALTVRGIHMVAIRVALDYLHPLRSGDTFFVGVNIERFRVKHVSCTVCRMAHGAWRMAHDDATCDL